jgi:hypothetical protein
MNNLVSINELENSLLAKRASIQSTKGFPKPEKKDGIDFYKKKDVEKFINSELTDFIDAKQTIKILNISLGVLMLWVKSNSVPFYRLKKNKGSKLLFKKNEIEDFKEKHLMPEKNENYTNSITFSKIAKDSIRHILTSISLKNQEQVSINVFLSVVCENKSLTEIAKERNLSKERVRQIYEKATRLLKVRFVHFNNNYFEYYNVNRSLQNENLELKTKIKLLENAEELKNLGLKINKDAEGISKLLEKLRKPLICFKNIHISVRTLNSLMGVDIIYVHDLISFERQKLLHLRNLGRKSYMEILDFLKEIDLQFIGDVKNIYELSVYKTAIKTIKDENGA